MCTILNLEFLFGKLTEGRYFGLSDFDRCVRVPFISLLFKSEVKVLSKSRGVCGAKNCCQIQTSDNRMELLKRLILLSSA
jgi:hypothetical protein